MATEIDRMSDHERIAKWMTARGYAFSRGDGIDAMLCALEAAARERGPLLIYDPVFDRKRPANQADIDGLELAGQAYGSLRFLLRTVSAQEPDTRAHLKMLRALHGALP